MVEREPFVLSHRLTFAPTLLMEVCKSMPLTPDGYVPLGMQQKNFESQDPIFTDLGGGAIHLALDMPFGFVNYYKTPHAPQRSQHTNGLILAPAEVDGTKWQATLFTEKYVNKDDMELFSIGVLEYARRVMIKQREQSQPPREQQTKFRSVKNFYNSLRNRDRQF